jgi:membrane protein implicated in regulation of membrane protease activity
MYIKFRSVIKGEDEMFDRVTLFFVLILFAGLAYLAGPPPADFQIASVPLWHYGIAFAIFAIVVAFFEWRTRRRIS